MSKLKVGDGVFIWVQPADQKTRFSDRVVMMGSKNTSRVISTALEQFQDVVAYGTRPITQLYSYDWSISLWPLERDITWIKGNEGLLIPAAQRLQVSESEGLAYVKRTIERLLSGDESLPEKIKLNGNNRAEMEVKLI